MGSRDEGTDRFLAAGAPLPPLHSASKARSETPPFAPCICLPDRQ